MEHDTAKELFEDVFVSALTDMSEMKVGTEEYSSAVDSVTKMYKAKLDAEKADLDREEKARDREAKKKEYRLNIVNGTLKGAFIIAGTAVGYWFETEGRLCSQTFKAFREKVVSSLLK